MVVCTHPFPVDLEMGRNQADTLPVRAGLSGRNGRKKVPACLIRSDRWANIFFTMKLLETAVEYLTALSYDHCHDSSQHRPWSRSRSRSRSRHVALTVPVVPCYSVSIKVSNDDCPPVPPIKSPTRQPHHQRSPASCSWLGKKSCPDGVEKRDQKAAADNSCKCDRLSRGDSKQHIH